MFSPPFLLCTTPLPHMLSHALHDATEPMQLGTYAIISRYRILPNDVHHMSKV